MTTFRCPQNIFDLFDADPAAARKQAMDWTKSKLDEIQIGDIIIVPDARTGEEWELVKGQTTA